MKPIFHPRLVNDVFGDPGLLVQFLYEKRALLFDLGDISRVPNGALLKVSDVFVSHTHIDHFVGFDHLLRIVFGRAKRSGFTGPKILSPTWKASLRASPGIWWTATASPSLWR